MRLLVTRPEPDAERTAAALRARGHTVLLAPLLQLGPLDRPDVSAVWAGVIVTSANALRALDTETIQALRTLPVIAVGERTAETARAAGFVSVQSADGDAGAVVRLAAGVFAAASAPVVYLAAEHRAQDIAAALERHGVHVVTVPVYRMETASRLPVPAEQALVGAALDGVLHYSRRSAEAYLAAAAAGGCLAAALAPAHYCLSGDIAQVLAAAGAKSVLAAPSPDEASLLSLIVND